MPIIRLDRIGPLAACCLLVAGCSKPDRAMLDGPASTRDPSTPQEVLTSAGCRFDVTEAEAREFFDRWKRAVDERRDDATVSVIDYDLLGKIGVRGGKDQFVVRKFLEGFREEVAGNPGGMLRQALGKNAKLRLLRITNHAGGRQALVRILGDQGLDYLDVELVRRSSGDVVAYDVFRYGVGERFSDVLRRLYVLGGGDFDLLGLEAAQESESSRARSSVLNLLEAQREGRFQDVVEGYSRLPEPLRKERVVLAVRRQAAAALEDDAYRTAMADIRKFHGDADWTSLLLLDDDVLRRDFDAAQRRLDRLDRSVGGDPYLDVLRSKVEYERRRFDAAFDFAARAAAADPELIEAHYCLLGTALELRQFEVVRRELSVLERTYDADVEKLVSSDAYRAFVESPEYDRWKQARVRTK